MVGERGEVASGDTPPVPTRVRRQGDDVPPGQRPPAGRRGRRRLPPVPPVPPPGAPVRFGAPRRRVRFPVVFAVVAVVLAGTIIWQGLSGDDRQRRPPATTRPAVPAAWRTFSDPDGTYRLSFPPTWTPTDRGPFIDFTEPGGDRFFRVQPTADGMAPLDAQRSLERSFMVRHPNDDYRRLRLGPTSFRSRPAAEWEFTFLDEGRPTRGYDITFVTGQHRHAILFQSPAGRWASSQDELEAFLAGFRPRG